MEVLNLTERKPLRPLIEIFGSIDCGKAMIVKLVARMLGCPALYLPVLTAGTATSTVMLSKGPMIDHHLTHNPEWWQLLAMAHIFEHREILEQRTGPLIVTNYLVGWRTWSRALGINHQGYISEKLPEPSYVYKVTGKELHHPGMMRFAGNALLKRKINSTILRANRKLMHHVPLVENRYRHISINETAKIIAHDIARRYKLDIVDDEFEYREF